MKKGFGVMNCNLWLRGFVAFFLFVYSLAKTLVHGNAPVKSFGPINFRNFTCEKYSCFNTKKLRAQFENITGGTVLIVGDKPDLCLLMKVNLLRKGSPVSIVHTFQEALNSLGQIQPDAVTIFLHSCENNVHVVESILPQAPNVRLMTLNGKVI